MRFLLRHSIHCYRIQAGQYTEAYTILEQRVKYELEILGERPDELADIYQYMAKCKSEVRTTRLSLVV